MNIGTEAVLGRTNAVDVSEETAYEAALELVEIMVGLNEDDAALAGAIDFVGNADDILATLKKNGVDAGTEALVGKELGEIGVTLDASDVEGTCAAIEEVKEKLWERTKKVIKDIIERIKAFFTKLFLNVDLMIKSMSKQTQRLAKISSADWKKKDKVLSIVSVAQTEGIVSELETLVAQALAGFSSGKFSIAESADMTAFVKGDTVSNWRIELSKKNTLDCSKADCGDAVKDAAADFGVAMIAHAALKLTNKVVRAVRVGKVEQDAGNKYAPSAVVRAVSSVCTLGGLHCLRVMRSSIAVLKNAK